MSGALLVIGNGRLDNLRAVTDSALRCLPNFDHYLMVDDSGDGRIAEALDGLYAPFTIRHHEVNRGMAEAVQAGFDMVLGTDAEWVFWLEEDMLLTESPPVADAVRALDEDAGLAQMCFRRAPVMHPLEQEYGCQLAAICSQSSMVERRDRYTVYDYLFSMGPCIIPSRILEYGWPAGPIGVGNEDGMTQRLLSHGYTFGSWGHPQDGQAWVKHIGFGLRAAKWKL